MSHDHTYLHGEGHAQHVHAARSAEDSAAFLLPHLTADTRLLDVGCGPGTITLDLADRIAQLGGSSSQVTGADSSESALASARELATDRGLGTEFFLSDASSLPFEDNSFDIVFASQMLHHVSDPIAALKEFTRVTRPGGLITSREIDYGAMLWYPPTPGLSRWRAVFSVISDLNGNQPNAGRHLPYWFTQAGLSDLTVSSSNWTYGSAEEKQTLASSWSQRTQEENYRELAAQALGESADEAIEQIVDGWNTWAQTPGSLFLMPHVEVIARKA